MQSLHLVLGRPLGHFPVGVVSKTCPANLSCGILVTCLNHGIFNLSIQRSGSTFGALRISQLRTLSRRELFVKIPSLPIVGAT